MLKPLQGLFFYQQENPVKEQAKVTKEIENVLKVFKATNGKIRPHFTLTGPSGSGKSHIVQTQCEIADVNFFEINAAQLTKEGISGNSLSKALTPLFSTMGVPTVCFVDEFDKLFVSGNTNGDLAHESTNGVQNEFLKILESDTAAVFGDFGKYINVAVSNVLFIFAGAFNGEEDITLDRLRELGIKTEFLGRVGLVYNTVKPSLSSLLDLLGQSELLADYLQLFPNEKKADVVAVLEPVIVENYEKNTLGVRMLNTLVHQYFIEGKKAFAKVAKQSTFQTTLTMDQIMETMTVGELKAALAHLDDDDKVVAAVSYGDRVGTMQAVPIMCAEDVALRPTAYSDSGYMVSSEWDAGEKTVICLSELQETSNAK